MYNLELRKFDNRKHMERGKKYPHPINLHMLGNLDMLKALYGL